MNGDVVVRTPRFGEVKISKVFKSKDEAFRAGYTEPTHSEKPQVYGKAVAFEERSTGIWTKFEWAMISEEVVL